MALQQVEDFEVGAVGFRHCVVKTCNQASFAVYFADIKH
jgi:hypothetical protein